jgi:hypothetical protein
VDDPLEPDAYLAGRWTVERAVHDARLGGGTFTGTATFAPDDGGLDWLETGRLRLGGYEGPARRRLRVAREDGAWMVRFDDGRPFHPLVLRGERCEVTHPCGEDTYAGAYVVLGPDAFDVAWRVRGPAKDQQIESRYRRSG